MRFKITLVLALIFPLLLAGCIGTGGSSSTPGTAYDGLWTVGYADSSFVTPAPPAAASGVTYTEICQLPLVSMTVGNGYGSTQQVRTCFAVNLSTGAVVPNTTDIFYYLISVSVTGTASGDILNAIVNGTALTGRCISPQGCSAQGLTMTR